MAIRIDEATAPGTPSAGTVVLYAKADGLLYFKDDAGTETPCGTFPNTAVTSDTLAQFAATTSAELRGILSDETGGGLAVFNDTPTIKSLVLDAGAATAGDAPLKMTSGALLTTAEAGTLEFLSGIFYRTQDTALGRGQDVVEQVFRQTADSATIGAAIAPLFGANSNFSVSANSFYEITVNAFYLKTTSGTVRFTLTGTGSMLHIVGHVISTDTTGMQAAGAFRGSGAFDSAVALLALPVSAALTTAVNHQSMVRFLVETDAAIDLIVNVTSSAGTITLRRGSMMTIRKLPSGNVGKFF